MSMRALTISFLFANHPGGWFFLFQYIKGGLKMKKLFSVLLGVTLVFGLASCTETDLSNQIATLEETLNNAEEEIALLKETQTSLEEALSEKLDVTITLSFTDLSGSEKVATYAFDAENVPALKDLLVLAFGADIVSSEYGSYLAGLRDVTVPYGAFIQISENGEITSVGIDDLTLEDGDSFQLDIVWWDPLMQEVYEALNLFVTNQLDNYISTEYIDYNVLLGTKNLFIVPVSETDITNYLNNLEKSSIQDFFKASVIASVLSDDALLNQYLLDLSNLMETGPYGQTALPLLALNGYNASFDYSNYVTDAITYYENHSLVQEGLDAGALGVMGLSFYQDDPSVMQLINDYVQYVKDSQLDTGGMKSEDVNWNETVYPGVENAATMSQVILALMSVGLDPSGDDFTKGDHNLITRLLEFQLDNGLFDWDLNDDIEGDASFSSPQAFLALAQFYRYKSSYGEDYIPFVK
jgi:hypothetical protein